MENFVVAAFAFAGVAISSTIAWWSSTPRVLRLNRQRLDLAERLPEDSEARKDLVELVEKTSADHVENAHTGEAMRGVWTVFGTAATGYLFWGLGDELGVFWRIAGGLLGAMASSIAVLAIVAGVRSHRRKKVQH
ncbi:hypothetical protein [Demequina aestuarii]|uniref:hypothetical protein n=1 Tax=Demequina aestuarii TaxID=327095 RepID=UPI00128B1853|nr:hypothetical protein [Demequina aestuarii]